MSEVDLSKIILTSGVAFVAALLIRDAITSTIETLIPQEKIIREIQEEMRERGWTELSKRLKLKKYKQLMAKWITAIVGVAVIWAVLALLAR